MISIWPNGKPHILDRVEFIFTSEDGEVRRIYQGKMAEYLYGKAVGAKVESEVVDDKH